MYEWTCIIVISFVACDYKTETEIIRVKINYKTEIEFISETEISLIEIINLLNFLKKTL